MGKDNVADFSAGDECWLTGLKTTSSYMMLNRKNFSGLVSKVNWHETLQQLHFLFFCFTSCYFGWRLQIGLLGLLFLPLPQLFIIYYHSLYTF